MNFVAEGPIVIKSTLVQVKAITWTNDDPSHWFIYTSGFNVWYVQQFSLADGTVSLINSYAYVWAWFLPRLLMPMDTGHQQTWDRTVSAKKMKFQATVRLTLLMLQMEYSSLFG